MSKNRPGMKGYAKTHVESGKPMFLVGAEDTLDRVGRYRGPEAQITWDDDWFYIVTDKYESHVMMNIEALDPLRKALGQLSRRLKAKKEIP